MFWNEGRPQNERLHPSHINIRICEGGRGGISARGILPPGQ